MPSGLEARSERGPGSGRDTGLLSGRYLEEDLKRSAAIRMIEDNLRLVLTDPGQPRRDGIPMSEQQMREQIAQWLVGLPLLRKELEDHGDG